MIANYNTFCGFSAKKHAAFSIRPTLLHEVYGSRMQGPKRPRLVLVSCEAPRLGCSIHELCRNGQQNTFRGE
jgi:hypothetical protein